MEEACVDSDMEPVYVLAEIQAAAWLLMEQWEQDRVAVERKATEYLEMRRERDRKEIEQMGKLNQEDK